VKATEKLGDMIRDGIYEEDEDEEEEGQEEEQEEMDEETMKAEIELTHAKHRSD